MRARNLPIISESWMASAAGLSIQRISHPEFVLSPGPFADSPDVWALELARGCAHRCGFCPARSSHTWPGDDKVMVHDGLADRVAVELVARREKPRAVLVGPDTDPFQPVADVQEEVLKIVRALARHGVMSWMTTRGLILPKILDALTEMRDHVRVSVALSTMDADLQKTLEPGAASTAARLELIDELGARNIPGDVRLEPMLPNVTDGKDHCEALLESLAESGVKQVTAGYLVLHPGVRDQIEREWAAHPWKDMMLAEYVDGPMIRHRGQLSQHLPKARRQRGYAWLMSLAANRGIAVRVNSLTNPDFRIPRAADRVISHQPSLQQKFRAAVAGSRSASSLGA